MPIWLIEQDNSSDLDLLYDWNIKYFMLIRKMDFSGVILPLKKGVAELEKYKIKTTKIKYSLMPIAIVGIFCMLIEKPIISTESIVLFALIIIVFLASAYYTFKFTIFEKFRKLNKEIEEVELLSDTEVLEDVL